MKSNIRMLIAAVIILVVLGGAAAAIYFAGGDDEETAEETTASQTEAASRLLYDKDPSGIENIHIKNETGEYDIKKFADDAWFVEEFAGINHSTTAVKEALDGAATVTSQQLASENAADMSVYGLDAPRADVTVSFGDGDKLMHIGADAPTSGLVYISFDDEKTVYAVNTSDVDCFLQDKFYYVAKTVYTAKQPADENDTTDYTKIDKITISRKDIDYDIVLEYDIRQDQDEIITGNSSSHVMTSPVHLDLNPDLAYDTLSKVFDLTASQVVVVAPSEAIMKQFGLDDPFCLVKFDIAGETFTFRIGNEYTDENGKQTGYFCYAEGIDVIYVFDNASVLWATVMPMDITMTMITSTYIYAVNKLEITDSEGTVTFNLNGDADNFAVECGDPDVTADSFKDLYQYILRAPAEELYLEENNDPAYLTVTIENDMGTDVIEFAESADRMSVIRLNGVTSFRCRTAYAQRLSENLRRILEGEKVITTW